MNDSNNGGSDEQSADRPDAGGTLDPAGENIRADEIDRTTDGDGVAHIDVGDGDRPNA
ncbi:MAG TPA: hypothetical protein VEZ48_03765 [Sphingomonadaceae bacterium]|nr:hypothetical protein [Sphingomonadaceae bacterium]